MTQEAKTKNYIIDDNVLYVEVHNELFSTFERMEEIPEASSAPKWNGAKIPFKMWMEMTSFCQVSYEKFKSEALILLFYCETEDKWHWWAPPQTTRGMTVSTNTTNPAYQRQRANYPDLQLGTLHHHCSSSAFQSGTDSNDEEDREGIHITIGKVGSALLDIHARMTIGNVCTDINIEDVVERPDWMSSIPYQFETGYAFVDILAWPDDNLAQYDFSAGIENIVKTIYVAANAYQQSQFNSEKKGTQAYLGAGFQPNHQSDPDTKSEEEWQAEWEESQLAQSLNRAAELRAAEEAGGKTPEATAEESTEELGIAKIQKAVDLHDLLGEHITTAADIITEIYAALAGKTDDVDWAFEVTFDDFAEWALGPIANVKLEFGDKALDVVNAIRTYDKLYKDTTEIRP